jgi:hypothetical protein
MSFWFLYDNPEKSEKDNLDKEIKFLLDSEKFSWDEIYLFSAFVTNHGVAQVKKILEHRYLNENTEVVIAIGTKDYFNKPSDIQEILSLSKSQKIKTKFVRFICPKTINDESHINDNFHIKAYCFLGSMKGKGSKRIGFSIIGSSNLTKAGLEGKGELCISIHNLNLTKELTDRLSNKYSESPRWGQEIIEEYARGKYKKEHSRKDQDEVIEPWAELNNPSPPRPKDGRSIEWIGGFCSHIIDAEGKNLIVQSRESELNFLYYSSKNIYEMEELYPVDSLCHLAHSNDVQESWNKGIKREIIKIKDHKYYSEAELKGCFLIFKIKLSYNVCDDILDIAKQKKYEEIFNVSDESILPYDTLKDFEEKVKEYQEMLKDPNYQKGLEKAKNKMQSEIDRLFESESDLISMKEQLKKFLQSI